jgi:hypothetical protein
MKLKLSKCQFGKREIETLGHKVSYGKIQPSEGHVSAIAETMEPQGGDDLARFFCVTYFSKHSDYVSETPASA